MTTQLKSEMFDNSYAIFISKKSSDYFMNQIKKEGYDKNGVNIINADFQDDLAAILIPIQENVKFIEKDLFEYKNNSEIPDVKNSGFWGQVGLGYKGKTWSV
jgi:hypothetical protein